uniref:Reverse transcriptase domain-containing protein n=1 Tax=Amphiprion percula TaxID=161767 RepID=A0A3P8TK88_AMPPE
MSNPDEAKDKFYEELDSLISLTKVVNQLSCGKAPGADAIPAEIYRSGGPALTQKLTELFSSCWSNGTLPQDFKDASIVHVYKRKGNRQDCNNHRGISLLSIAGKILARVHVQTGNEFTM